MPEGSRSILVIHSGMVYSLILPSRLPSPGHASVAHLGVVRATNEVNVGSCEPSVGSAGLRTSASFWSVRAFKKRGHEKSDTGGRRLRRLRSLDVKKTPSLNALWYERKIYLRLSSWQQSFLTKTFFSLYRYIANYFIYIHYELTFNVQFI